jgi:hypothetical protein
MGNSEPQTHEGAPERPLGVGAGEEDAGPYVFAESMLLRESTPVGTMTGLRRSEGSGGVLPCYPRDSFT